MTFRPTTTVEAAPGVPGWPSLGALLLATLIAVAALGGILLPSVYAAESPNYRAQGIGQDWVNLVLATPWLISAGVGAFNGSRAAARLLAGGLFYCMYTFALYVFSVHFNALFLVYCAALGVSFYLAVPLLLWLAREPPSSLAFQPPRWATRAAGAWLVGVGALFAGLWLGDILPALIAGSMPDSVAVAGLITNPVEALDLSLVLPAHVLCGVWLLRDEPRGRLWGPVLLSFGVLMSLSIAGMMLVMHSRGVAPDLGVAVAMIVIALVDLALLVPMLRSTRRPRTARTPRPSLTEPRSSHA